MFTLTIDNPELAEEIKKVANPQAPNKILEGLCQKEVDIFDQYVREYGKKDPMYQSGIAKYEREVLVGYLYQKYLGRVDEFRKQRGIADR